MDKLLFGTGGIPFSTKKRSTLEGIREIRMLKLDAMELEFVHSVNIKKEKTPEIKKIAEEENVMLTCHAPYYINLNSANSQNRAMSRDRIIRSAQILNLCGGWSVAFHPGFYMKSTKEDAYKIVKEEMKKITEQMSDEGNEVWIRPEVTGKISQFGDLQELLKISQELDNVMPCIDYAHLQARSNGKINTKEEFSKILEEIEKALGRNGLDNMHIQIAGVEFSEKGEKRHLELEKSTLKYADIAQSWKDFRIKGVVISESPNLEKDALIMQRLMK